MQVEPHSPSMIPVSKRLVPISENNFNLSNQNGLAG